MDVDEEDVEPVDPGEYLLNNAFYYDYEFIVGDPEMDEIETICVCSAHLVSHSTVFRSMLLESPLAFIPLRKRDIHITDISPAVFKLMLRHLYGGKLPVVSRDTAAQLLLCADKYNIQPLVNKTGELLVPNNTNELFLALECVARVCVANLELSVSLFLREHCHKVVKSEKYLLLDVNCLVFIAKQEVLSITELELWRSLLRWVKAKSEDPSQQRLLLAKLLPHVRFLSLAPVEITKEVASSKIFSSEELFDMISAVLSDDHILTSSSFCRLKTKRLTYQFTSINEKFIHNYNMSPFSNKCRYFLDYKRISRFVIRTGNEDICVKSFQINSRSKKIKNDGITYICNCSISFHETVDGCVMNTTNLPKITQKVICDTLVILPLHLSLKHVFLVLEQHKCYYFVVKFDEDHPAFKLKETDSTCVKGVGGCYLSYDEPHIHVTNIVYKTQ